MENSSLIRPVESHSRSGLVREPYRRDACCPSVETRLVELGQKTAAKLYESLSPGSHAPNSGGQVEDGSPGAAGVADPTAGRLIEYLAARRSLVSIAVDGTADETPMWRNPGQPLEVDGRWDLLKPYVNADLALCGLLWGDRCHAKAIIEEVKSELVCAVPARPAGYCAPVGVIHWFG